MKKNFVCVFAHPDDEAFGPGGTIAQLAKTHNVYILCATKGQAQKSTKKEGDELGKIRSEELLRSAKILGVKKVYFLGFRDGTLCNNFYHKLTAKIQEKLEKYKPESIMTFEPRGISGHIDHITVSMATSFVFKKSPFVKKLLYYCILEKYSKLREEYFIYFPPGYQESDIDEVIDTKDVWETKVRAMQQHQSQIGDVKRILKIQSKFPKKEYFTMLTK